MTFFGLRDKIQYIGQRAHPKNHAQDANHETKHGSTPLHQNGTALPLEDSDAIGKVLLHPHVQVEVR